MKGNKAVGLVWVWFGFGLDLGVGKEQKYVFGGIPKSFQRKTRARRNNAMSTTDIVAEANFRFAQAMKKSPIRRFFTDDGRRLDFYDTELVIWNAGHLSIQFDLNSRFYTVDLR